MPDELQVPSVPASLASEPERHSITKGVTVDLDDLQALVGNLGTARRLVAIAGAPGSGKSTLTDHLIAQLNAARPGIAAVLPMDGYHFDDRVLVPRGLRPRKGAPETFDVAGLRHMLKRLGQDDEEVAVPVFDRDIEIARAAGRLIPQTARIIVVEGNYLLLDRKPWSDLHPWFDVTVMLRVPVAVLRQRLTVRWDGYGLSADEVRDKVEANDLPNGVLVMDDSITADYVLQG